MELDVDEGGFGPFPGGMTGTVHNWTGGYPNYHNDQHSESSKAALDRTAFHTFGASYDPRTQTVAWWLDGAKLGNTKEKVPAIASQQHFYLIMSCQSHTSTKGNGTGVDYTMLVRRVRAFVPPC